MTCELPPDDIGTDETPTAEAPTSPVVPPQPAPEPKQSGEWKRKLVAFGVPAWLVTLAEQSAGGAALAGFIWLALSGPPVSEVHNEQGDVVAYTSYLGLFKWHAESKHERLMLRRDVDAVVAEQERLRREIEDMEPAAVEARVKDLETDRVRLETQFAGDLEDLEDDLTKLDGKLDSINDRVIRWLQSQ